MVHLDMVKLDNDTTTVNRAAENSTFADGDVNNTAGNVAMAAASTSISDVQPCHLLKLPAELRTAVYSLVLVYHDRVGLTRELHEDFGRGPPDNRPLQACDMFGFAYNLGLSPSLLSTCRQIHQEGTSILYGHNRFLFRRNVHMSVFLLFVQTTNGSASLIRDIEFWGEYTKKTANANIVALKALGAKLDKLHFGRYYQTSFTPLQMANAVRPLTRALDKKWKADAETKLTPILDRLNFPVRHTITAGGPYLDTLSYHDPVKARWRREVKDTEEFSKKVKGILMTMLKK